MFTPPNQIQTFKTDRHLFIIDLSLYMNYHSLSIYTLSYYYGQHPPCELIFLSVFFSLVIHSLGLS